jgi:hypothetical protein
VAGARELPSSREAAALAPPVLHVEPAGIAFEVQAGDDMPTRTLTIANRGGQTLSWSISPPPTLRVTPSSGEVGHGKSMKISVSPVAAALPDEDQQYDLQVDAPGGQGGPGSVKVDLIIIPPDPEIQVTAPDTGSQWEVGSLQTVVWSTVGEVAGPLGVELSTDGGLTWKPIGRASVDARGARLKTPAVHHRRRPAARTAGAARRRSDGTV